MEFSRRGARGLGIAGCLLAAAACTSTPAKQSAPTGSAPAASSTSPTVSSAEAEKAAVLKAYQAYAPIQKKLDAAKPISAAEINAVSTGPWRAQLTKRAKPDPDNYVVSTGPVPEKVISITVTGTSAVVVICRDETKIKVLRMPAKLPLNAPSEPLEKRITYTKAAGTWLFFDLESVNQTCEVGQ
jgi:hypothetical protein